MLQTGVSGLLAWAKQVTSDFDGVDVTDFTSSWRSGLAFCAIIARFRPDLIDFDNLNQEKCLDNCRLAFDVAETKLKIPALLEAKDMVEMKDLDSKSIITYVSQLYHKFNKLVPQPALRRSLRRSVQDQDSTLSSKDSGLEDSMSDSRVSSPLPNSSRTSSPVSSSSSPSSSSSSRQSSAEDSPRQDNTVKIKSKSFQSLHSVKDSDKPLVKIESSNKKPSKPLGPKSISFIAALQKFSSLSTSTPNLHKDDDKERNSSKKNSKNKNNISKTSVENTKTKTRTMSESSVKNLSRTTETQTEKVVISDRAIQTDDNILKPENNSLYARSASISNLYISSNVPNCDKQQPNTILQGLSRYRGSQRLLSTSSNYLGHPVPAKAYSSTLDLSSRYASCDNLQARNNNNINNNNYQVYNPQPTQERKYQCCTNSNWRLNETIGVYNTKHYEHNRDFCNQRFYEPNPLYGYSAAGSCANMQQQGYFQYKQNKTRIQSSEAIYQNTGRLRQQIPDLPSPRDCRIVYNSKNQTFSTLV